MSRDNRARAAAATNDRGAVLMADTGDIPQCEHTGQTMLGVRQCLLWAGHENDPATRSHSFLQGVSGGGLPEARSDMECMAVIVGDLWDYPPDVPITSEAYAIHLTERYGSEVAVMWARLGDGEEGEWVIRP